MKRREIDLVIGVIKGLKGKVEKQGSPIKNIVYWKFANALKEANGNFNEQAFRKDCGIDAVPG